MCRISFFKCLQLLVISLCSLNEATGPHLTCFRWLTSARVGRTSMHLELYSELRISEEF